MFFGIFTDHLPFLYFVPSLAIQFTIDNLETMHLNHQAMAYNIFTFLKTSNKKKELKDNDSSIKVVDMCKLTFVNVLICKNLNYATLISSYHLF